MVATAVGHGAAHIAQAPSAEPVKEPEPNSKPECTMSVQVKSVPGVLARLQYVAGSELSILLATTSSPASIFCFTGFQACGLGCLPTTDGPIAIVAAASTPAASRRVYVGFVLERMISRSS